MGFGIPLRTSAALGIGGVPSLRCAPLSGLAPALNLIFTDGETLDSRITFTRSTTATRTNSSGLIESVAINTPRFDYNPTTLQPKGLLIEEQRTNLVLNSLIDGTILSTQIVTVSATAYTLSFYGTGTVTLSGTHSATVVGTGAYPSRKTYTFTPTVGALTVTVSGTVQFAQLEAGSFATSFIPTAASQVTRTADVAVMTGANFSSWYNQSEGMLFTDGTTFRPYSGSLGGQFAGAATDANNRFFITQGSAEKAAVTCLTGGVTVAYMETGGPVVNGGRIQAAFAYKLNDFAFTSNGVTPLTDTSGTPPTVTTLYIGGSITGSAAGTLNGHLRRIAYFPRRLANSELQALTA